MKKENNNLMPTDQPIKIKAKDGKIYDNTKLQGYQVQRQVLLQPEVHRLSGYETPKQPLGQRIINSWTQFSFVQLIYNLIPVLEWMPKYSFKNYFCGDLSAGITIAVMHIPQGMAYGILAGVAPKTGLYMAFLPTLVYVIFGTSRHNSMGTFAVISIMCAKVVATYLPPDPISTSLNATATEALNNSSEVVYTPIQIVTAISFCTSVMYFMMFVLRLGTITSLLSEPLISGFVTGASAHVFVSQLKDIFGIPVPRYKSSFKLPLSVYYLFQHITEVNYTALIVSCFIILYMICMNEFFKPWFSKKSKFPFPIELVAVIMGVVISLLMKFPDTHVVNLVGKIPVGLPEPVLPPFALIKMVAVDCIGVAIVSYSVVISMGMLFAKKGNYIIRPNQELLALGACNMIGSLFSCIPMSASLSRTALQYETGGKTQVASIISASIILCVLLWIGPIFEALPRGVLGGIIVVALKGVYMQALDLKKFYKQGKMEAFIWIVTFLVVVIVDIDIGLLVGVITSIAVLYWNGLKHYSSVLGQIGDTGVYVDLKNHRNAEEIPKTKIFRYCGSINFATRSSFRRSLYKAINLTDVTLKKAIANKDDAVQELNGLRTVIIDLSCCGRLDQAGCNTLADIQHDLTTIGAILLLACPSDNAYKALEHSVALGLTPFQTCPTVHDAVLFGFGHHDEV